MLVLCTNACLTEDTCACWLLDKVVAWRSNCWLVVFHCQLYNFTSATLFEGWLFKKFFLFKTAHAGMIFSGVSCKERQKLDVSEELTSTTGCRGRGLNRWPFSLWASTLPLSYPAWLCNTANIWHFLGLDMIKIERSLSYNLVSFIDRLGIEWWL